MCFTCSPITVPVGNFDVVYRRHTDDYSDRRDSDLTTEALDAYQRGDWQYVALAADVLRDGQVITTSTLYGIPEGTEALPCALEDTRALAWVTTNALEQAAGTTRDVVLT